jgi:hypothetical protein
MDTVLEFLKQERILLNGETLLKGHDGCVGQYWCGNSEYLDSMLMMKHNIVIDQAISAPRHGKDVVDGINAVNKRYLAAKMCLIGTPKANNSKKLMQAYAMINGTTSKSLAEEAKHLCKMKERLMA